jgi:ribonuclease HII
MRRHSRKKLKHLPGAIGVDEAGRGPLAGPVVVAAVVIPKGFSCAGLNDSKLLSAQQREEQAQRIKEACRWSVVCVDAQEIDRLNILWSTMAGMERAVEALAESDAAVFIDGDRVPHALFGRAEALVGGDRRLACIAAASILAKTHRDALMREYALQYPQYGFGTNFGYSTPDHFEALRLHGPCPLHRRSFAPVREAEQPCLIFAP